MFEDETKKEGAEGVAADEILDRKDEETVAEQSIEGAEDAVDAALSSLESKSDEPVTDAADEAAEAIAEATEEPEEAAAEEAAEAIAEAAEKPGEVVDASDAPEADAEGAPDEAEEPRDDRPEEAPAPKEPSGIAKKFKNPTTGLLVGCAVVALVIGLLIGALVIGGGHGGSGVTGKTVISEGELNSPVASYNASGKGGTITASEVIEQTSSLEAVKDADGNYAVPSADSILSVARNKIIVADAESRGIKASDEEIAAYAEAQLGTSDYASIAQSYGMDEASVVELLRESCVMSKLRDEVLGDQAGGAGQIPAAPTEPAATTTTNENGEQVPVDASQVVTKEYADYIIGLVGDEWNSATGTWASQDGPYYQALSSYQITPEGASYEAATTAYYVAYQNYSESASAVSSVWSDYVNGLLSKATINIFTLLA